MDGICCTASTSPKASGSSVKTKAEQKKNPCKTPKLKSGSRKRKHSGADSVRSSKWNKSPANSSLMPPVDSDDKLSGVMKPTVPISNISEQDLKNATQSTKSSITNSPSKAKHSRISFQGKRDDGQIS